MWAMWMRRSLPSGRKLRDYILQMEENIADTLGVDREQINVKATTEEHLGFTGDSSGMACHAVCLLMRL